MNDVDKPAARVTLESKVAFLRLPTSYPEPSFRVEAIETHMSWVFLTDCFAYKLKKPVRSDDLDFTTVDARRYYCEEEVRLNRRLAADVYLGLAALTLVAPGQFQFNGEGPVLDWLVKMRRLPRRHMLDYAVNHGTANAGDMRDIAARLVAFYHACPSIELGPSTYRAQLLAQIDHTMQALSCPAYGLATEQIRKICQAQREYVLKEKSIFDARILTKKLVEGHGDLRPEHICLSPPAVIDCLEFSLELRILDPIDEISFLALECERLGAPCLGVALLAAYSDMSNDNPDPSLMHFYKSYRACVRARIAIGHLNEEKFRYSPEWPRRANEYLSLAQAHSAFFT